MKRLFLMSLAAMGLALTGCNNDETVEMAKGKAIGFSSFVGKSTRATDVTIADLGSMEVYGWRGAEQIFNAQQVTVAANGEGSYSPLQYWEANYVYNFEAIAPKHGDKGVQFAAAKDGGTITFENDGETDLIYAKATEMQMPEKITAAPEKVNFTFKHQLARVKFTFKNTFPGNAAAKITITDVNITNAYKKGSLVKPDAADVKWTVVENDTFNIAFASENIKDLAAGGGSAETAHHYLIPTGKLQKYTVTFKVSLDQNGATTVYVHSVNFSTTQEQGKSYNYVAELHHENIDPANTLYPIEFTATVDPWVEVDASTIKR